MKINKHIMNLKPRLKLLRKYFTPRVYYEIRSILLMITFNPQSLSEKQLRARVEWRYSRIWK